MSATVTSACEEGTVWWDDYSFCYGCQADNGGVAGATECFTGVVAVGDTVYYSHSTNKVGKSLKCFWHAHVYECDNESEWVRDVESSSE